MSDSRSNPGGVPPPTGPNQQTPPTPERAPAGKFWTFLRILNVRLRFIVLMVIVGVVAGKWDDIMNYYDRWRRPAHAAGPSAAKGVEYYCPMHPNIISANPGNCPICGMPLSERAKTAKAPLPAGVLGQVQLTPQKMIMGRIGTSTVEYRRLTRQVRTVGVIEPDQTRQAAIAARVKGRLDTLLVNYTGQKVDKGDPLALIYSPDLLVAQDELLSAVKSLGEQKSPAGMDQGMGRSLVDSVKRKLLLWGLSEQQVEDIVKSGKGQTHVTILSPISGIVMEKKALEGKYVAEGEELYTVADLSTVWAQMKVFEGDIDDIPLGTQVELHSPAYPNETFEGRIAFVAYSLDPSTRTVLARVEIANPELKLRPGMYVNAIISLQVGPKAELAATRPSASQPASAPAMHHVDTEKLAQAYLSLLEGFGQDKPDPAAIAALAGEADALADHLPQAAALAAKTRELEGKDLDAQRQTLMAVSAMTIQLLRADPPATALWVAHCPMVDADWITADQQVRNPYSSQMRGCGSITGQIERAQGDKVLAVPESAIIDTGTRKVAYREGAPGVFDMVEVRLGPRAGEFYPVLAGLKEGDRVATQGAFLVDAENRLNPAAGVQYLGASGSPQSGGQQGAAPSPAGGAAGHQH
jgi:membrane fusion protein, copper/silver efflux system